MMGPQSGEVNWTDMSPGNVNDPAISTKPQQLLTHTGVEAEDPAF